MLRKLLARPIVWALDRMVAVIPENAHMIVRRGCLHGRLGDLEQAIADFSTAIELVPTYGEAYRLRAVTLLRMHQAERAMEDIQEDLRFRPENAATRATYGDVLREMQQHAEALREYNRAIELDPHLAIAFLGRALCHSENGDWQNAVADFRRVLTLGAKNKEKEVRAQLSKAEEHLRKTTRRRR